MNAKSNYGSSTMPRTLTRFGPPLMPSPKFVRRIWILAAQVSDGLIEPLEMGQRIDRYLRRRDMFWRVIPIVLSAAPILIGLMLTMTTKR